MPNLNTSILGAVPLSVPSLATQAALVSFFNALDDRIDVLRQTNATLESIAQTLFKSWFIDFDPVRAKAEGREPEGMDAETAALFPDSFEDSALGEIPKGWSVIPFGELLSFAIGGDWGAKVQRIRVPNRQPLFAALTSRILLRDTSTECQGVSSVRRNQKNASSKTATW